MGRKLLFYTHAFCGGGAEVVFARLARAFADAGDNVIFAADHAHGQLPFDAPRLRHVLLAPGDGPSPTTSRLRSHATSTALLADLLRRETPTASFSALGAQNLKHVIAATLVGRRSRCVLGYHGFADVEPKFLSRLSYRLSPITTRFAARTVCVSDALLDGIATTWGAYRPKMVRIYNPVQDPDPDFGADASDPNLVLALGRLVPFKRFPDLVEAFARVRWPGAQLAILGEGPERPAIEAQIARLGLGNRVRLLGHVVDPMPWYRRAACLAISSQSESFGLTAAEALAHGVPVVTTACVGPPEVLGKPPCGRIVPVGDIDALAQAITETLAAPGDPGRRRARAATFRMAEVRDRYAELIDSLG